MGDNICPWWLAYAFDNPFRRLFHSPEKILRPYVAEGMTVLDVGCGMGFFSIGLAKLVGNKGCVIAVDVQQKMLNVVRRRTENDGISDRIRIHRCESNKLGVELRLISSWRFGWCTKFLIQICSFIRFVHASNQMAKSLLPSPGFMFHQSASKRFSFQRKSQA